MVQGARGHQAACSPAAVDELFYQDETGTTAFEQATIWKAPVAVLESMLYLAKLDTEKRNILDIADIYLCLPLHIIAQ